MPRLLVGLHVALVAIIALFGLSFLLDPCGGGGDLCLGGAVGLLSLGVAAVGIVAIVVWVAAHRASPLLVLDAVLVTLAAYTLPSVVPGGPVLTTLGVLLLAVLGVPAGAMAGRAVATHRIERLLAAGVFVAWGVLGGAGGAAVLLVGLLALGSGWLLARQPVASPVTPP